MNPTESNVSSCDASCLSRRTFLGTSGAIATMTLGDIFPGRVHGHNESVTAEVRHLPRKQITTLSELVVDQPIDFSYPDDADTDSCMLVKTGERSGGGIGEQQDIVAFSSRCTHMGGSLKNEYQAQHKVAGPCRLHLTTFDLTRHGMVVAGHATAALPQIILELDGEGIFATGIVGLIYGCSQNSQLSSPAPDA